MSFVLKKIKKLVVDFFSGGTFFLAWGSRNKKKSFTKDYFAAKIFRLCFLSNKRFKTFFFFWFFI